MVQRAFYDDLCGCCCIYLLVASDDAAEARDGVGVPCLDESLSQGLSERATAGVGVLHDAGGRLPPFADQVPGPVQVEEVDEGQGNAMDLFGSGQSSGRCGGFTVE